MSRFLRISTDSGIDTGSLPVSQDLKVTSGLNSDRPPFASVIFNINTTGTTVPAGGSRLGIGLTDGSTQRCIGVTQENGGGSGNCDSDTFNDTDTVVRVPTFGTGTLAGEASFSAFTNGGVTVSWADLLENLLTPAWHFFECESSLVDFTPSGTNGGTADVNTLTFVPDMVIVLSHFVAYSNNGAVVDRKQSFGVGVKTPSGGVQQVAHVKFCNDRNPLATSNAGALHDNAVASAIDQTSDGPYLELTTWLSNGATFTTRRANISAPVAMLFLRTRRKLWAGIPTLVTSSTGVKNITDPGFHVEGYMCLASNLVTKNTTSRVLASDSWSYGAYSGEEEFCVGGMEADAAPDAVTFSRAAFGIASLTNATGSAFYWEAIHSSLLANGFSIEITDASASDNLAAFVAWGPGDPLWPKRPDTWRNQLVRR